MSGRAIVWVIETAEPDPVTGRVRMFWVVNDEEKVAPMVAAAEAISDGRRVVAREEQFRPLLSTWYPEAA